MRLTDQVYNAWKKLVLTTFPALSSFIFVVSYIWEIPSAKFIMGLSAIVTFLLGICLTISSKRYVASEAAYDGTIIVMVPEEGPKVFSLELKSDPEDLEKKESITFKVLPSID